MSLNRPLTFPGFPNVHNLFGDGSPSDGFDGAAICGTMMRIVLEAKWPGENPRLPWHANLSQYQGGLTQQQLYAAFAEAWKRWSDVIEIRPEQVDNYEAAFIRKSFGREDGPNGVLAWSYLADNTNNPKAQQYDYGENWLYDQVGNGIDLIRVACHEIGHVLGLDHDGSNAAALLRPTYSTTISKPTERDISRAVGLGYKRRTTVPPVPPIPPIPPPNPVPPPLPPVPATGMVYAVGGIIRYPDGSSFDPGFGDVPLNIVVREGRLYIAAGVGGAPRVQIRDYNTKVVLYNDFIGNVNSRTGVNVCPIL